jgi:ankyrin repeat protein
MQSTMIPIHRKKKTNPNQETRIMSIQRAGFFGLIEVTAVIWLILALAPVAEANNKNSELIAASHQGRLEEVKRLLDEGVDVNAKEKGGQTALVMAAMNGHTNTVKLLLGKGADINAGWPEIFDPDLPGGTALMHAAKNGHIEVVRLLVDNGADINANFLGSTALKYSAMNGHVEVVKFLLDKGAEVAAGRGRTALTEAALHGRLEVVRMLLDKGADINGKDGAVWTPLIGASYGGHLEVAKLLVERGADINAMKDWEALTAMAEAERRGHYDIVQFLKAHGAKELSFKNLKGEVVESSSKNLSVRVRDTPRPETIIVKVGLRTKFIPFRKPVGGEKVYVEYLDQDGSKYAYTVQVINP